MAIGARSQSARTYLEKTLDELDDCELEALVAHGLRALRDTLPNEVDLTNKVLYTYKLINAQSRTICRQFSRVKSLFFLTGTDLENIGLISLLQIIFYVYIFRYRTFQSPLLAQIQILKFTRIRMLTNI